MDRLKQIPPSSRWWCSVTRMVPAHGPPQSDGPRRFLRLTAWLRRGRRCVLSMLVDVSVASKYSDASERFKMMLLWSLMFLVVPGSS